MRSSVTIKVPCSTSNIGPGFDCLGIALGIYNLVTVSRTDEPSDVDPEHLMVREAAGRFFRRANVPVFGLRWKVSGDVPVGAGLGSSVTIRLGVLAALNELSDGPLTRADLFDLCSEIEGHPDNAGPATFGGFVLTDVRGGSFRFEVSARLKFVLLIPEMEVLTEHARKVLPAVVPHREAAVNIGNACAITAAFATGQYEKMRDCFGDALHQPWRAHLVPGLLDVIAAGSGAGALGGFLSGSGPAICCVALDGCEQAAAAAMLKAWNGPVRAGTRIVTADNMGAHRVDEANA